MTDEIQMLGFQYTLNHTQIPLDPNEQTNMRYRLFARAIRINGVAQMNVLQPFVQAKLDSILRKRIACKWTPVQITPIMQELATGMMAQYMFGDALCGEPAFSAALSRFYSDTMKFMGALQFTPDWISAVYSLITNRGQALNLVFKRLRRAADSPTTEWRGDKTLKSNLHFIFIELCARPDYVDMIREELRNVKRLDYEGVSSMQILDSFIKETVRLNPSDKLSIRRKALKPYNFSHSGPHVAQGQIACVSSWDVLHDESIYANADAFDGLRFVKTPNNNQSKSKCTIDIHNIDGMPVYEATSYVWGAPEDVSSVEILATDQVFRLKIPKNLERGLRRFRKPTESRVLWADSICINQTDDDERGQQILLMGHIYRNATNVLIWLGEHDDEKMLDKACTCMKLVNASFPKVQELEKGVHDGLPESKEKVNTFLGVTRRNSSDVHNDLGIPLCDSPEFEAFITWSKNPWFLRAWTWQETFLARNRIYHCGTWHWTNLFMRNVGLALRGLGIVCGNEDFMIEIYRPVLLMCEGLDFWTRRIESPKIWLELSTLLSMRRGTCCKYPSDLVYSLIGAARNVPNFQVDYKLPFEEVFATSAWHIMLRDGNLSILSRTLKDQRSASLPTWVPDWRFKGHETGFSARLRYYDATNRSKPKLRLSADTTVLSASGFKWDQIFAVKSARSKDVDDWLSQDYRAMTQESDTSVPPGETFERAARRTTFLDMTEYTQEREVTRWQPHSHEEFEEIVKQALNTGERGRLRYATLLCSMVGARAGKCYLITATGRIGIACDNILKDDIIAMLQGGRVPVVLRPMTQAGHYEFVAECYVHGFMDGEALGEPQKSAEVERDTVSIENVDWIDRDDLSFPVEVFHIH
ncbi:uncharacterized protein KY384_006682 [Bacidia gigantensis]|uniref:uncharacterized protein n=1 Tax=Bacidia gigantensis TaxID=2732470 RepID=UPI001D042473|nr:uncharacterized protein KY384_006682 [Bacidia gigantensis]KAG8528993.1 hypothetical protein KY384_006682 [Bacidia gigantensis]